MEDPVPIEDEIEWVVMQLRNHRPGGPSEMRAEHLKGWLAEARKEEAAAAKAKVAEGVVVEIGGPWG